MKRILFFLMLQSLSLSGCQDYLGPTTSWTSDEIDDWRKDILNAYEFGDQPSDTDSAPTWDFCLDLLYAGERFEKEYAQEDFQQKQDDQLVKQKNKWTSFVAQRDRQRFHQHALQSRPPQIIIHVEKPNSLSPQEQLRRQEMLRKIVVQGDQGSEDPRRYDDVEKFDEKLIQLKKKVDADL